MAVMLAVMSEIIKLNMVTEYWKHSDAGLRDELNRMAQGFAFYFPEK